MLVKSLIVIFSISFTISRACDVNSKCDINLDDAAVKDTIAAMQLFTTNMWSRLLTDTSIEGNITFSPANLYMSLALLMYGTDDTTQKQIVTALNLDEKDLGAIQTALKDIANGLQLKTTVTVQSQELLVEELKLGVALYVQSGISLADSYLTTLKSFDAETYSADFKNDTKYAVRKINEWADKQTAKRTPITVTEQLAAATKLLLATGSFFSTRWQKDFFISANNQGGTFMGVDKKDGTPVIMMNAYQNLPYYDNGLTYSAIQIPPQVQNFMVHVILPYGNANLNEFLKTFTVEELLASTTNAQEKEMVIRIPKLGTAWTGSLVKQLEDAGVTEIFSKAKLKNMVQYSDSDLSFSLLTQSAGLVISELGVCVPFDVIPPSERTQVGGGNNPPMFMAERPFLLVVRHVPTNLIVHTSFVRQI